MKKRVLCNIGEKETRIAILFDQKLVDVFIEDNNDENKVGNVYRGVVEGIVPGIQAAFVNIGLEKNAFLHFNDVDINKMATDVLRERQMVRRRSRRRVENGPAPDQGFYIRVEDCLKQGQNILVQMTKEAIGTKGARISAMLTLPGKYMVLLPGLEGQGGVSKKVEDLRERRRLKKILSRIDVPEHSFIIRTAGIGKTAEEIYGDVDNLLDTYDDMVAKSKKGKKPALLHAEGDIVERLLRDNLPDEVSEILIDNRDAARGIAKSLRSYGLDGLAKRIKVVKNSANLFSKFNIEQQINEALRISAKLDCGGSIVIEETEALTAIDVNSGSFIGKKDQEKTILKVNLDAARTIARQLRLRDIGGLIVVDFIDMQSRDAQRRVRDELRKTLMETGDKFSLGSFSEFGCLEMTRKRVRRTLSRILTKECAYCAGTGRIRVETQIWREIKYSLLSLLEKHKGGTYELIVHPNIAEFLEEHMGKALQAWEKEFGATIDVRVKKTFHFETFTITRNGKVLIESNVDKMEDFHDVDFLPTSIDGQDEEGEGSDESEDRRPARRSRRSRAAGEVDGIEDDDTEELEDDSDDEVFEADDASGDADDADEADEAPRGRSDRGRGRGRGRGRRGKPDAKEARKSDEEEESFDHDEPLTSRRDRSDGDRPDRDRSKKSRSSQEEAGEDDAAEAPRAAKSDEKPAPPPVSPRDSSSGITMLERRMGANRMSGKYAAASTMSPRAAKAARFERPDGKGRPGLYGAAGIPAKRDSRRKIYEPGQKPASHYGWTPMGPQVGNPSPVKEIRSAPHVVEEAAAMGAEPSLFVKAIANVEPRKKPTPKKAAAKKSPAKKTAAKKTTAQKTAAKSAEKKPAAKKAPAKKAEPKKSATSKRTTTRKSAGTSKATAKKGAAASSRSKTKSAAGSKTATKSTSKKTAATGTRKTRAKSSASDK